MASLAPALVNVVHTILLGAVCSKSSSSLFSKVVVLPVPAEATKIVSFIKRVHLV